MGTPCSTMHHARCEVCDLCVLACGAVFGVQGGKSTPAIDTPAFGIAVAPLSQLFLFSNKISPGFDIHRRPLFVCLFLQKRKLGDKIGSRGVAGFHKGQ